MTKLCKHPGCNRPARAPKSPFCSMHEARDYKGTDMDAPYAFARTEEEYKERFISRLSKPDNETGCVKWLGYKNSDGYGMFHHRDSEGNRLYTLAHRYYYENVYPKETIPEGLELGHYCEELGAECNHKDCVVHVRPMTKCENHLMDNAGERHPDVKVPDAFVKWAVECYEENPKVSYPMVKAYLADMGFEANVGTIHAWVTGKSRNEATGIPRKHLQK